MVKANAAHRSARRLARARQRLEIRPEQFQFVERWDGFRIEHPLRHAVDVRLEGWRLILVAHGQTQRCPIFDSPMQLSRRVACALLGVHETAERRRSTAVSRESWMIARTTKAMRRSLLHRHVPLVGLIEEQMVALNGEMPRLTRAPAFYRARYIGRDVARYRAAAIAAAFLESTLWPLTPEADADRTAPAAVPAAVPAMVRAMRNWRGLFAPGGTTYGSLDRTLMNLSPHIPGRLVCGLRHVRLERAITNRLELHFLLQCVRAAQRRDRLPACLRTLQHARELAIRGALARVGEATERRLDAREDDDLRFAANFLMDADPPDGAGLRTCVERAVRWHRPARPPNHLQSLYERITRLLAPRPTHPSDTPTARPVAPLPHVVGLRFLPTVGEIVAEGERMQHCIASYADDAVSGRCFLFHAEHDGEMASFEVSRGGDIRQAVGPRNGDNGAVLWGAAELTRWVASWRRPAAR